MYLFQILLKNKDENKLNLVSKGSRFDPGHRQLSSSISWVIRCCAVSYWELKEGMALRKFHNDSFIFVDLLKKFGRG